MDEMKTHMEKFRGRVLLEDTGVDGRIIKLI
jgi:hypothetical protein